MDKKERMRIEIVLGLLCVMDIILIIGYIFNTLAFIFIRDPSVSWKCFYDSLIELVIGVFLGLFIMLVIQALGDEDEI